MPLFFSRIAQIGTGQSETRGARVPNESVGLLAGSNPGIGHGGVLSESGTPFDSTCFLESPGALLGQYELVEQIDAAAVQAAVNRMATATYKHLSLLMARFHSEQSQRDDSSSSRLRFRLNQIMLRVRLEPLPDAIEMALARSWDIVGERFSDLLPAGNFPLSDVTL